MRLGRGDILLRPDGVLLMGGKADENGRGALALLADELMDFVKLDAAMEN